MTPLERRYRRLLRVLPRWYRADREEEMVDTFLSARADRPDADLDLEHGGPGWAEVRATVGLSVRARFAATRPAGDVVRLIAVLGLSVQFAISVPGLVFVVQVSAGMSDAAIAYSLVHTAAPMAPIVLLLAGRRRAARIATVLALVLSALTVYHSMAAAIPANLPFWLAAGCLLVGFHAEAPLPRSAPWWWVLGIATGVVAAWTALLMLLPYAATEAVVTEPLDWLLLACGTVWLIQARTRVVALALAGFAAAYVPGQIMLFEIFGYAQQAVQLAATAAFVVTCAVVGSRVSAVRAASTA